MSDVATYVYVVGTAGSGKSSLTHAFCEWCKRYGFNIITVNLDPGVKTIPYDPEIDVREWIVLDEVMNEYNLGPNGAQVVCADLLALNITELKERLSEFRADYVIFDTPGQLELFAFRSAGKIIIDFLGKKTSILSFLIDPALATTPENFVVQIMLSGITQFKLDIPQVNILTKKDIIEKETFDMILSWSSNMDILQENLINRKTLYAQLNEGIMQVVRQMHTNTKVIPVSSETYEGMEDLYTIIQNIFYGGEDLEND